jgi:hypothetical protein
MTKAKMDEVVRTNSRNGREDESMQGFGGKARRNATNRRTGTPGGGDNIKKVCK